MINNKKTSSFQTLERAFSSDALAILLIALSFAIQLGWMIYTRHVEEDAFITFRYAKQIAIGNGFVYNIGEHVYGTTTPLFTILLALWLTFISSNIILGASILNLLAAIAVPIFTWKTLKFSGRSSAEQHFVLIVILLSSKFLYITTNGMEISLSMFLMASSWYAWVRGKTKLTGLLCGLLLWTRIDSIFWVIILVFVSLISSKKNAVVVGVTAALTYLPWVVFATLYFGSPIPHTVTAKWVNYIQFNQSPYIPHLAIIVKYLSPLGRIEGDQTVLQWIGVLIVLGVSCWGIWKSRIYQEKYFYVLIVFTLFEISRLTLTRATFFTRYFIPILWSTLILFGMGLGALWDRLKTIPIPRTIFLSSFVLLVIAQVMVGISYAQYYKEKQTFRHEASLKAMGLWLKNNTSPQSIILLEPLGYVGYYSERHIIEEVGLVTPSITNLKLQKIGNEKYTSIFKPDYVIVHCDDEIRIPHNPETGLSYKLIKTFNPLGFYPNMVNPEYVVWGSCYQIWKRDQ
jgi:hypothetical protein